MYPYYRWSHWHRWSSCKPPSRLRWFLFGAGSALWWIKHKEAHSYHNHMKAKFCSRHQIPPEAYPLPGSPQQQQHSHWWIPSWDDRDRRGWGEGDRQERNEKGEMGEGANRCGWHHHGPWSWGSCPKSTRSSAQGPPPSDGWDEEKLRMMEFSNKANEKVHPNISLH